MTSEELIPLDVNSKKFHENLFIKIIASTPDKWLQYHFDSYLANDKCWEAKHIKKIAQIRGIELK